jgi:hypothetical protein
MRVPASGSVSPQHPLREEDVSAAVIQDGDVFWLPLAAIAKQYDKHPEVIRQWCKRGFMIELGFRIRKDETGHWAIGVPKSIYQNFTQISVDTIR